MTAHTCMAMCHRPYAQDRISKMYTTSATSSISSGGKTTANAQKLIPQHKCQKSRQTIRPDGEITELPFWPRRLTRACCLWFGVTR